MTNDHRTPRAFLPRARFYEALGIVLSNLGHRVYETTENDFVGRVMKSLHGGTSPQWASQIYRELMAEAGLDPL